MVTAIVTGANSGIGHAFAGLLIQKVYPHLTNPQSYPPLPLYLFQV